MCHISNSDDNDNAENLIRKLSPFYMIPEDLGVIKLEDACFHCISGTYKTSENVLLQSCHRVLKALLCKDQADEFFLTLHGGRERINHSQALSLLQCTQRLLEGSPQLSVT